jgi:ankyrin repeat protein
VNINQTDHQGRTVLHYCAEQNNLDCTRLLLEDDFIKKSLINLQDIEGCSALHLGR